MALTGVAAGELNVARQIVKVGPGGTAHFHPERPDDGRAPRQAPAARSQLVGRAASSEEVVADLTHSPGVVVLAGMGGVGKTSLAQQIASDPRVEQHFKDGTLWAVLHGGDVAGILDGFVRALKGEPAVQARSDLMSRAAEVRSLLHDRSVLVVLDDAWDAAEVELFRPGAGRSAVLVTTRDEALGALISDHVHVIETLERSAAFDMLEAVVGRELEPPELRVAEEVLSMLGGLPLGIELTGKRMRLELRRIGTLEHVAEQLRTQVGRLDLELGNRGLRATFALSFDHALSDASQLLFRRLGIFTAVDLTWPALGAVWETSDAKARAAASALLDLSLVQPAGPDGIRLHPLLRDFAAEKAGELPHEERIRLHGLASDHFRDDARKQTEPPKLFADILPVLLSHWHATRAEDPVRADDVFPWFGSTAVMPFLRDRGYVASLLAMLEDGVAVHTSPGGRAAAEWMLGAEELRLGLSDRAIEHFEPALAHYRVSDYDLMVAKVAFQLGQAYAQKGDEASALTAFEEAFEYDTKIGNADAQTLTIKQIGDLHRSAGDLAQARESYERTRELAIEHGAPRSAVIALMALSEIAEDMGSAVRHLDEALALAPVDHSGQLGSGERFTTTSVPFRGRDGAELLGTIANRYRTLDPQDPALGRRALRCLAQAVALARDDDAPFQLNGALYGLANILEHWFLYEPDLTPSAGRTNALEGAFAGYTLADRLWRDYGVAPQLNPGARIETRLRPRLSADEYTALSRRVDDDADGVLETALLAVLG